jgi:hypothetical protein
MVIQYNYFIAQTNICRLPFAALLDSLPLIDQVANKMLQKKDCQQIPPDNTYPQQLTKKRMFLFWFWYLSFEYVCFCLSLGKTTLSLKLPSYSPCQGASSTEASTGCSTHLFWSSQLFK